MDARKRYPSDLTDLQWHNIEHLFHQPKRGKGGRPRTYALRDIVDALFYLARGGCSWRMLPHDFPPWGLVSYYFYTWRDQGLIEEIHAILRVDLRRLDDREPTPSAAVVDSQSVKTTEVGGPKGYDAGKKNRRSQAPCAGGHARADLGVGRSPGQRAGLGRGQDLVAAGAEAAAAFASHLGGRSL